MASNDDYSRIERVIRYLIDNFKRQPSLEELAEYAGLSQYHFQKLFTSWAGVSPKKFLQHLTVEALKEELKNNNIACSADNVGLSSQSRVYDLFVSIEAVTPNEYRTCGEGVKINYGFAGSPFGECFVAVTERGVCALFFPDEDASEAYEYLDTEWRNAEKVRDDEAARKVTEQVFYPDGQQRPLRLLLRGTPFQVKVWRALVGIRFGKLTSYGELADLAGDKKATRAVASAVARNPVSYIVPCHRVIRSEGIIGQYHWKPERKAAIISWEKSRGEAEK